MRGIALGITTLVVGMVGMVGMVGVVVRLMVAASLHSLKKARIPTLMRAEINPIRLPGHEARRHHCPKPQ